MKVTNVFCSPSSSLHRQWLVCRRVSVKLQLQYRVFINSSAWIERPFRYCVHPVGRLLLGGTALQAAVGRREWIRPATVNTKLSSSLGFSSWRRSALINRRNKPGRRTPFTGRPAALSAAVVQPASDVTDDASNEQFDFDNQWRLYAGTQPSGQRTELAISHVTHSTARWVVAGWLFGDRRLPADFTVLWPRVNDHDENLGNRPAFTVDP